MMVGNDDIICAISTPAGVGAIAVVRLSGRGCAALVDRVYTSPSDRRLQDAAANTVHFGYIKEGDVKMLKEWRYDPDKWSKDHE